MNTDYTPARLYRKYAECKDKKSKRTCLKVLSELTCLTQEDLLALLKKEAHRTKVETQRKEQAREIISNLVCELATVQTVLAYLRYLGYESEDHIFYYWRVKDEMKSGRFVLTEELKEVIKEGILTNKRPLECYKENKLDIPVKEFRSAWYRVKYSLSVSGEVTDTGMTEMEGKLISDIKSWVAEGVDEATCYQRLKGLVTKKRFKLLCGKAFPGGAHFQKPEESEELEELEEAAMVEESDEPDIGSIDWDSVVSKLKGIHSSLGDLINELEGC